VIHFIDANTANHFKEARILFQEYIDSLGIDLSFQAYQTELADLASIYSPPNGAIILAKQSNESVGCVGLRKYNSEVCEMKRLYMRPQGRGRGLGMVLCQKIISRAKAMGYGKLRLDTLPTMTAARELYKKIGFYPIDPYYDNPIAGTAFMELNLG